MGEGQRGSLCANGALSAAAGGSAGAGGASVRSGTAQGLHLFDGGPGAQPPPWPLQASGHGSLWVSADLRARLGQAQPQCTLGAAESPLWGLRPSLTQASWEGDAVGEDSAFGGGLSLRPSCTLTNPSTFPHTHTGLWDLETQDLT